MADDFYGYSRNRVGHHVMSTDLASIYFSNQPGGTGVRAQKAGLIQSSQLSYQHRVEPRFEAGSAELHWLSGQSQGTIQINRLIAENGILSNVEHQQDPNDIRHGLLGSVEVKIGKLGQQGIALRQDVLIMSGCILTQYGMSFNVGGLEVSEAMTVQVALLQRRRNSGG